MAELAQISPAARPPGWTGLSTGSRRGDRPDPDSVPQADASHALAASERPLNHLLGRGAETAVAAQPTPIRPVEPVHLHGTALDRGPRTRRDRSASLRPGSAHLEPQAGRQIVFQILEGGSLRARCRDGEKQCGSDKHRGLRPRSIGRQRASRESVAIPAAPTSNIPRNRDENPNTRTPGHDGRQDRGGIGPRSPCSGSSLPARCSAARPSSPDRPMRPVLARATARAASCRGRRSR